MASAASWAATAKRQQAAAGGRRHERASDARMTRACTQSSCATGSGSRIWPSARHRACNSQSALSVRLRCSCAKRTGQ